MSDRQRAASVWACWVWNALQGHDGRVRKGVCARDVCVCVCVCVCVSVHRAWIMCLSILCQILLGGPACAVLPHSPVDLSRVMSLRMRNRCVCVCVCVKCADHSFISLSLSSPSLPTSTSCVLWQRGGGGRGGAEKTQIRREDGRWERATTHRCKVCFVILWFWITRWGQQHIPRQLLPSAN